MKYLFNISILTHKGIEDEVTTWINDKFIPVVADPVTGFEKFEVFKLLSPLEKDNCTYCVQIRSTNRKKIEDWYLQQATPVAEVLYKNFEDSNGNSQVILFPSLMELVP